MSANQRPKHIKNIKTETHITIPPQPENAIIPENEIVLIINTLRTKTHETIGNKPEMNNKPNMNSNTQQFNPLHQNQLNQINQRFRQKSNPQLHHYQKMK